MRGEDKASLLLVNCSILLICNKVICNKAARNLSSHGFNYFIKLKLKCVLIIAYDYAINIFRDLINELRNDWFQEYKPVLAKIKTPQEVSESIRLNEMMFTSDPDDLDEIGIDAMFGGIRRA